MAIRLTCDPLMTVVTERRGLDTCTCKISSLICPVMQKFAGFSLSKHICVTPFAAVGYIHNSTVVQHLDGGVRAKIGDSLDGRMVM